MPAAPGRSGSPSLASLACAESPVWLQLHIHNYRDISHCLTSLLSAPISEIIIIKIFEYAIKKELLMH